VKELYKAQLFFPIVLALEHPTFTFPPDHITIFPSFYSIDRRATIPQVLVQSFCKDYGDNMVADPDAVNELTICSSDMPSISALAKDMAVSFPQIGWLNLCFERRCDVVSFLLTIDDYKRT
jgi:hypothetical protein